MKKLDERQKALVATAESYYARGVYLQYDDTRAVTGNVVKPPVYRWSRYYLNSPEDTTRQNITYTNCAKFTYDVYKEALGLDIVNWCTEMLIRDGTQEVYRYEVSFDETPERKELVERTFTAALRVGDIIVNRHVRGGGHAMLYVGNGNIIHSMGSRPGNYNYNEKKDYTEPYGTVVNIISFPAGSSANDWYYIEYRGTYGWIFSVGEREYNVGLWLKDDKGSLVAKFQEFLETRVREYLGSDYEWIRRPKGAVMGIGEKRSTYNDSIFFIGDAANTSNEKDGEGISLAVKDALTLTNSLS